VEQVSPVFVDLDTGLRFRLRIRVTPDMGSPVHHEDPLVELRRDALSDRKAEESGSDDKKVVATGSR
jgi:hypothetical protein